MARKFHTRRRLLIALSGLLAASAPAVGQQGRLPRIGLLGSPLRETSILTRQIVAALQAQGYRDGSTAILEHRSSGGDNSQFPKLARELIAMKCDLVFALGIVQAAQALRDASAVVPIVFFAVEYDPVSTGIVNSLSRPRGNVTGVYLGAAAIPPKHLEAAQEVLPQARRFFVLSDADSRDQLASLQAAAEARRVKLITVEFDKTPYDLARAFDTARREKAEAFIGFSSPNFSSRRAEIGKHLAAARLPAFVGRVLMEEPSALVAYTFNIQKAMHRAADIGARILKGTKPSDIPVEQADEFEVVVNLKTAEALGLKVPQSLLARATRLIQ